MIAASLGIATALMLIALARVLRSEAWLYALSLLMLPAIYAGFALWSGDAVALPREFIAGLPFVLGGMVLAFWRRPLGLALVGLLWLLHAGYDFTHAQWFVNAGVPVWYPLYCASVDAVVGLYLLVISRRTAWT